MKIFRYKIKFNEGEHKDEVRIVSVGVKVEKNYNENNVMMDISYHSGSVNSIKPVVKGKIISCSISPSAYFYGITGKNHMITPTIIYNEKAESFTLNNLEEGRSYVLSYSVINKDYSKISYKFAMNIVAPMDELDLDKESKILSGRLDKYGNDFTLPKHFHSYGLMKATAFSYCRDEFQEWCDKREIKDKFSIEDYKV